MSIIMWYVCLCVCLSVCPHLVIFYFPDFIQEKGNAHVFLAADYDFRVLLTASDAIGLL